MKRLILFTILAFSSLAVVTAQSGSIIDDVYLTPNDAVMLNGFVTGKQTQESLSTIYRNGAKEIVFIDKDGNRTTAISDTIYLIDGEIYADTLYSEEREEGYYLNDFNGSQSDFEYAERIRRFHNPRYTITIADPGYNDIYFLDDNYWNVHVDGMYATITPTWNNPYWWNYNYAPYSYSSWAWRHNWGSPYYSYYGLGWGSPWYGGYYDPWYSGYYGWGGYYGMSSYYGWGWPYSYYGGYYGWGYPYYGGYYGGYYNRGSYASDQTARSLGSVSRSSYDMGSTSRRASVARSSSGVNRSASVFNNRSDSRAVSTSSAVRGTSAETRMRTGAVRSAGEWSAVRSANSGSTRGSSVVNRSNPATQSVGTSRINSRSQTGDVSIPSRSSVSTSSRSSTYSTPSRSSTDFGGSSVRSSGSISSGSSRSSGMSGGSIGGGSRSSAGGGRR